MGRNPDGSITIHTLGDFIENGYDLYAHCDDCKWETSLNLDRLAKKLGRDHSALAPDLTRRMKCSRCGSKKISFTVVTRSGWDGMGGHSLSVFNKDGDR